MPSTTAANSFAIGLNRMGTSMFLPIYKVFGARCLVLAHADQYWIGIDLYGSLVRSHAGGCAASRVVQPDTILRWHRAGFRAYWRFLCTNVGAIEPRK